MLTGNADQGRWRGRLLRTEDNAPVLPWLRDRGSLTARIQANGRFALRLLRQGLDQPTADEAHLLGVAPGTLAWVREVALLCDDQLLVFAHTVLPRRPRGPLQLWLARLGTRSLGALLFAHPGFRRGQIHFRRIDRQHALFDPARRALQDGEWEVGGLWARRSHFRFGAQSVLVTEVFSPRIRHLAAPGNAKHAAGNVAML